MLAVTGTNGKTSTAWWLAQALSSGAADAVGSPCAVVGTLGIGVPPELTYTGLTTPDPVLLQRELRGFVDRGFGACAIEASSIGIAERRLDGSADRAWRCSPISRRTTWTTTAAWMPTGRPRPSCSAGPACAPRWSTSTTCTARRLVANLIEQGVGALDVWTVSAAGAPARLMAQDVGYDAQGLRLLGGRAGRARRSACPPR